MLIFLEVPCQHPVFSHGSWVLLKLTVVYSSSWCNLTVLERLIVVLLIFYHFCWILTICFWSVFACLCLLTWCPTIPVIPCVFSQDGVPRVDATSGGRVGIVGWWWVGLAGGGLRLATTSLWSRCVAAVSLVTLAAAPHLLNSIARQGVTAWIKLAVRIQFCQ